MINESISYLDMLFSALAVLLLIRVIVVARRYNKAVKDNEKGE